MATSDVAALVALTAECEQNQQRGVVDMAVVRASVREKVGPEVWAVQAPFRHKYLGIVNHPNRPLSATFHVTSDSSFAPPMETMVSIAALGTTYLGEQSAAGIRHRVNVAREQAAWRELGTLHPEMTNSMNTIVDGVLDAFVAEVRPGHEMRLEAVVSARKELHQANLDEMGRKIKAGHFRRPDAKMDSKAVREAKKKLEVELALDLKRYEETAEDAIQTETTRIRDHAALKGIETVRGCSMTQIVREANFHTTQLPEESQGQSPGQLPVHQEAESSVSGEQSTKLTDTWNAAALACLKAPEELNLQFLNKVPRRVVLEAEEHERREIGTVAQRLEVEKGLIPGGVKIESYDRHMEAIDAMEGGDLTKEMDPSSLDALVKTYVALDLDKATEMRHLARYKERNGDKFAALQLLKAARAVEIQRKRLVTLRIDRQLDEWGESRFKVQLDDIQQDPHKNDAVKADALKEVMAAERAERARRLRVEANGQVLKVTREQQMDAEQWHQLEMDDTGLEDERTVLLQTGAVKGTTCCQLGALSASPNMHVNQTPIQVASVAITIARARLREQGETDEDKIERLAWRSAVRNLRALANDLLLGRTPNTAVAANTDAMLMAHMLDPVTHQKWCLNDSRREQGELDNRRNGQGYEFDANVVLLRRLLVRNEMGRDEIAALTSYLATTSAWVAEREQIALRIARNLKVACEKQGPGDPVGFELGFEFDIVDIEERMTQTARRYVEEVVGAHILDVKAPGAHFTWIGTHNKIMKNYLPQSSDLANALMLAQNHEANGFEMEPGPVMKYDTRAGEQRATLDVPVHRESRLVRRVPGVDPSDFAASTFTADGWKRAIAAILTHWKMDSNTRYVQRTGRDCCVAALDAQSKAAGKGGAALGLGDRLTIRRLIGGTGARFSVDLEPPKVERASCASWMKEDNGRPWDRLRLAIQCLGLPLVAAETADAEEREYSALHLMRLRKRRAERLAHSALEWVPGWQKEQTSEHVPKLSEKNFEVLPTNPRHKVKPGGGFVLKRPLPGAAVGRNDLRADDPRAEVMVLKPKVGVKRVAIGLNAITRPKVQKTGDA